MSVESESKVCLIRNETFMSERIDRIARQGNLMNCPFRFGFECGAEKERGFVCATNLKYTYCKFFTISKTGRVIENVEIK